MIERALHIDSSRIAPLVNLHFVHEVTKLLADFFAGASLRKHVLNV
jgi:hypothetical protein